MSAVARRYAKALFALAREEASLPATAEQLERLAAIGRDPALREVLSSPLLSVRQRKELAEMLVRESSLTDLLGRFVRFLADQQRLGELASIQDHFEGLLDSELGRVRIAIRAATELSAEQQQAILQRFAELTGKQVLAQVEVDPTLLGGVVVEVAGKVYDGSVRSGLQRLAAQLGGTAH